MHRPLFVALLLYVSPSFAQNSQDAQASQAMTRLFEFHMRRSETVATLETKVLYPAAEFDVDGETGLSVPDYALFGLLERSSAWQSELSVFMRNDLNGDDTVTRAEILPWARLKETRTGYTGEAVPANITVEQILSADTNADNAVSVAEFSAQTLSKLQIGSRSTVLWMELISRCDLNGDAVTTQAEIQTVFRTEMQFIDTDGNAEVNDGEIQAFAARVREHGQFKPDPTLPPQIDAYIAARP